MFNKFKLRSRFIIVFLIIGILPMLSVSFLNFFSSKREIQKNIIESLKAVNNSRATHINNLIALRQEQTKEFAASFLFRQLKDNAENDQEKIDQIQKHIDYIHKELKLSASKYYQKIDQATDIEIIAVWDARGTVIASTKKEIINDHMPVEYREGVKFKGAHFGGIQVDPFTGNKYILILDEIKNIESDQYAGSVIFFINSDVISDATTSRDGLGKTGETYVVDNQFRMQTPSRFIDNSIIKLFVNTEKVDACFENAESNEIYTNYRDQEVLGVHKYISDLDWCLITEMGVDEAYAPIIRLRNQALFLALIFIVLIIMYAYYSSRSIIKPVLRLNEASKRISSGKYGGNLKVEAEDELGELTEAFNDMSQKLAKAQAELIGKNTELIKSLELSNKQKLELEKVNTELDRYVSIVSHDIGSPISGIIWCADLIKKRSLEKLDDKDKTSLQKIIEGAERLKNLTQDLLTITKLSRIRNPFEEVSISELLNSVLRRMTHDIEKNEIQCEIQKNLPVIICDRIKVGEIFFNLLNNAIKFSSLKEGQTRIKIAFYEEDNFYWFYVKDNGPGINENYQKDIFEVFNRGEQSASTKGTGVGLHIVKSFVLEHGGTVKVESKESQGACFSFSISKDLKKNSLL